MDTSTINTLWRPVYGELVKGVQQLTPEWQNLKQLRNFSSLSPRSINWPVELRNGGGMVWTSDTGSTALASSNEPPEATDSWSHLAGRFEIGFDAMVDGGPGGSKSASSRVQKQMRYQAADKLRSFRRAVAIGYYGYPDAIMFHATGANVSNPSGTQTAFGIDSLYGGGTDLTGALGSSFRIRDYLTEQADNVVVHVAETTAERGEGKIISGGIDETNDILTIDSSSYFGAAITANDAVVLKNQALSGSPGDLNLGINGLLHLTRDTTVHGISSATYADWSAGVNETAYGSAVGGADLYEWFETIEQRSDMAPTFAYTTVKAIAAAGGPELDQKRYGSDENTMRLGFKNLNVMGVEVQGRPYCPSGFLFIGSQSAMKKIAPDEDVRDVIESGDRAGGFQQYPDRLGFFKDQVMRTQIAAVSRLGLGVVSGVSEN